MNDILFELLKAIVIITVMLLVRYGIPYIRHYTELMKNDLLTELITAAVQYAEQTIKASGSGREKKAIVTEFLKTQLKAKDISISDEQLNALIEAAVYTMNREAAYGDRSAG